MISGKIPRSLVSSNNFEARYRWKQRVILTTVTIEQQNAFARLQRGRPRLDHGLG